jgi:beta-lactamase class A
MYSDRPRFAYREQRSRHTPNRLTARPKASNPLHLLVLSCLLLAGSQLILSQLATAQKAFIQTTGAIIASSDSIPIRLGPNINKQQLDQKIGELISDNSDLNISVSYKDISSGRTFHYGTNKSFVAASVSKLLTASYYLSEVDKGNRSLNDTIAGSNAKTLLRNLIVVSDNAAWVALDKSLGAGNLENFAVASGLQNYKHSNNTLTSDDVLALLNKIYRGGLLSRANTDLLLSYMQQANYRQYIVASLPSDATVYHKVGFLEDRLHDTAIVDNGRFPYILVIFTESKNGMFDFVSATSLAHDITETINSPYEK